MTAGASTAGSLHFSTMVISTANGVSIRKTTGSVIKRRSLLIILLNQKNEKCQQNRLYQRIRAAFPITFAIVEDIKRDDHRILGKQLHRFIADVITAALLEVQRKGIAAIPHVDALICHEKQHATVCEANWQTDF